MLELLDPIAPETDTFPGALLTPRGALPLTALSVAARIDGLIAATSVRTSFVNGFDEPLEATYLFPLPDRAAVTRCRFEAGGRVIEADLQEKNQARQTYQRALKAGHRAALAEEETPGVFRLRVGNLMPGETASVLLDLVGPVPLTDGEATYRFPLVIAPRYAPTADPNAPPRLAEGQRAGVDLSIEATFTDALSPTAFRSTMPTVNEETGVLRVAPGQKLDRDFVLRWRFGGEGVRTSLAVCKDDTGDEGTFLLTLVPPAVAAASKPREVVFVLDRSGSMGGWKMVAARRAVARMVESLNDRDRFAVYAFDDRIETPPGMDGTALVAATPRMRTRAVDYLATVDAEGGTEMAPPLKAAAQQLAMTTGDRTIVLITDGQVSNEEYILQTLGPLVGGVRVFTLGIDQAVNAAFLRRLANLGGGRSEVVESEQRLDAVMDQVHRLIGSPVWTGLKVEAANAIADSVTPARLPDLFAGAPVFIAGRYRGAIESLKVSAAEGALSVPARRGSVAVGPVWARGRIRDLEDRIVLSSDYHERSRLEREIIAASLTWHVLSRLTAYVAVDRAEAVNEGGRGVEVTQPVEQPAGWVKSAMSAPADPCNLSAPMETESVDSFLMELDDSGATATDFDALAKPAAPPRSRSAPAGAPSAPPRMPRRSATAAPAGHAAQEKAKKAAPQSGLLGGLASKLFGMIGGTSDAAGPADALLRALKAEAPTLALLRRHQVALEALARGNAKLTACLERLKNLPDDAPEADVRSLYADLIAALEALA